MRATFRILHLSDFHWDEEKEKDQKIIVDQLVVDLQSITKDKNIDAVVFSGDLVNKGRYAKAFEAAKITLLDRVRDSFGLTDADLLICPGNHDVDRRIAVEQNYIEAGLKAELHGSNQLNKHVDTKSASGRRFLKRASKSSMS